MTKANKFGIKSLRGAYILALSIVAALSTVSCLLLISEIKEQESSSRIINISGRQRMLSQNITKNTLILNSEVSDSIKQLSLNQLSQNIISFQKAHNALQKGDTGLEIPKSNLSSINKQYFQLIEPHFNFILSLSQDITLNHSNKKIGTDTIHKLINHETKFLELMDKVTFQFDLEAREMIVQLKRFEIIIWLITIATLFLEAFFIFQPIIRFANNQFNNNVLITQQLRNAIELKEQKDIELAEEQRKSVMRMVLAEESERKRIATELHESAGQQLAALKLNLYLVDEKLKENSIKDAQLIIQKTQSEIDGITKEVRNIAYDLIPPSLSQFGLSATINEEVYQLQSKQNIRITLESNIKRPMDQRIEIIMYRAFQEVVRQFTKPKKNKYDISIQLSQNEKEIYLNGHTNDKTPIDESDFIHFNPKINLLNGSLTIESNERIGTNIIIRIPLH